VTITTLEEAEIIPGKHSDTRTKPLPLTSGHGRYITATSYTRTGTCVRWEMPVKYIAVKLRLEKYPLELFFTNQTMKCGDVRAMQEKDPLFWWVLFFFSHLRGRGALCLSSYLTATSPKVTIFKNGLRSTGAFRCKNGSGAH
jgi:hypothetical protein